MPNIMRNGQLVKVKHSYIEELRKKEAAKAVEAVEVELPPVEGWDREEKDMDIFNDPDAWTVKSITKALDEANITYEKGMRKADLLSLLSESNGIL